MSFGGFSEHQNKTSDTKKDNGYFFAARVSQVNVNTMKKHFEQRSELQAGKGPIVHLQSTNYSVCILEIRNKKKATQQCSFRVANDISLN